MVYSDRLFDLAYEYKKTKLWKDLYDTDIFAIQLEDGQYAYISILGHAKELMGMNVYIGDEAFNRYKSIYFNQYDEDTDDPEIIYSQSSLQVSFDEKEFFTDEEFEEVASYNKRHKIRTKYYPNFTKQEPCYEPWRIFDAGEQKIMEQALVSVIALAKALEKQTPNAFGIHQLFDLEQDVLLVSTDAEGNIQKHGYIPQPEWKEKEYPIIQVTDFSYLENIRMFPQHGVYESQVIHLPNAVLDEDPAQAPYFPAALLMVNRSTETSFPIKLAMHFEKDPEQLLINAMEGMENFQCYPKVIRCADERTYALLCDFAGKMNIKISVYDRPLRKLEKLKAYFAESMTQEEVDGYMDETTDMIHAILDLSDEEVMNLPQQLRYELIHAAENHILDEELCRKILQKFKRSQIS